VPVRLTYRQLLKAARTGEAVRAPAVEAELIRRCCTKDADRADPRGLTVRRASIRGRLDLSGAAVPFPLRFEDCVFDAAPLLERARLATLVITGGSLPGLLANGVRVGGDLDLSRATVGGAHRTTASTSKRAAIWLCESQIGGRFLCVDTIVDTTGERALQADRMRVAGTVRLLHGFTANAEVRLIGARIDGSLDLTGAHLADPRGLALDLAETHVGGSVFLIPDPVTGRRPVVSGRVDLGHARIGGQFLVRGAAVSGTVPMPVAGPYAPVRTDGTAINAPRLTVGGDLTFSGDCRIDGGVDLALSDLAGLTAHGACEFRAPGGIALDLTNAELRSSLLLSRGVAVRGTIRLGGARVHGKLSLRGVRLGDGRAGGLVSANGTTVDGDLDLEGLTATGGHVRFRNASIGGAVYAAGATLDNPAGQTLGLHQCAIGGSVRLVDGFRSTGYVLLNRSIVEGRVDCRGGHFTCPGPSEHNRAGHALEAVSATAQGGLYLGWETVEPSVDLTNARTTILADDPARWPPRFVVSGLTYERFERPAGPGTRVVWDRRERCAWLARQAAYDAGPYEQLARVLRQHGHTADAEAVLIAQRHAARRTSAGGGGPMRRALDAAYGWTVGYGFRPSRVLWLLIALLFAVAGSLHLPAARDAMRATDERGNVYAADGRLVTVDTAAATPGTDAVRLGRGRPRPDACGDGQVRCFSPSVYAIDTVVPLISLGQRSTWYANPHAPHGRLVDWWLNLAALAGWLLSTIFVLSFTRTSRSP
jgi:hypothetical protein